MSMESAARMSMMRMTRGQSDAQQSLARGTVGSPELHCASSAHDGFVAIQPLCLNRS